MPSRVKNKTKKLNKVRGSDIALVLQSSWAVDSLLQPPNSSSVTVYTNLPQANYISGGVTPKRPKSIFTQPDSVEFCL